MVDKQEVLYIPELAAMLGRTHSAIASAHKRGQIPGGFILLGKTAWKRADIEAWIDSAKEGRAPEGQEPKDGQKPRKAGGRPRKEYDVKIIKRQ